MNLIYTAGGYDVTDLEALNNNIQIRDSPFFSSSFLGVLRSNNNIKKGARALSLRGRLGGSECETPHFAFFFDALGKIISFSL